MSLKHAIVSIAGVVVAVASGCGQGDDDPQGGSSGAPGGAGHGAAGALNAGESGEGDAGLSGGAGGSPRGGGGGMVSEAGEGGIGGGGESGDGGTSGGTGGTSAGVGGTSAGVGGTSAGVGGTSAGASGKAGAGGASAGIGGNAGGLGGASAGTGGNAGVGGVGAAGAGGSGGSGACIKVTTDGDDALAATSGGLVPFANIAPAIDYAATHPAAPRKVCVAGGSTCATPAEFAGPTGADLAMRDGVSVYGRYESTGWSRCAGLVTTLAPGSGKGVYFGPAITSTTVLDGFVIARFADSTTAGVTFDGAHGAVLANVEVGTDVPGASTAYGVDALNGAEATIDELSMTPTPGVNGYFSPRSQVGIHVVGAKVTARHATLRIIASGVASEAESVTGVWLEDAAGSAVRDSHITLLSDVTTLALHAESSSNLVLSGTTFDIDKTNDGGPMIPVAAELTDVPAFRWQGGTLTVRGLLTRGVLLEDSPNAVLDLALNVAHATDVIGIELTGDVSGTVLDGTVSSPTSLVSVASPFLAGVSIHDCAGASPLIRTSVTVRGVPTADAILVYGDCAPTISALAEITLNDRHAGMPPAPAAVQTLSGIRCVAPSRCTIDQASAAVIGGDTPFASFIDAFGIRCDSGACPTIIDSQASGLSGVSEHRAARYTGGGISAPGATLVSRNTARAGCSGGNGVGLVASGRIENNVIEGPDCGAAYADGYSKAVGLEVSGGAAVVHSNDISAGTVSDCPGIICDGYYGCVGTGVHGGAEYLNNQISGGGCRLNVAVNVEALPSSGAFPNFLVHNALSASATLVAIGNISPTFPDFTAVTTPAGVNALPGASGNFSTGTLVDAGTPLDAPVTDKIGVLRDESPDVGAYELVGAPTACRGVFCSNHGVCRVEGDLGHCVCDPSYMGEECEILDPCSVENGGCDPLTTCSMLPGGWPTCGPCPGGYTGDGASGCSDIDECAADGDVCAPPSVCANQPGTFACFCPSGYVPSMGTCVDIDECLTNNGGCDVLTTCTNVPGGRTCGQCPAGFTGDGATGCTDIDECATDDGGCVAPAICINEPGASTCACPPGYTGTPATGCVDSDECAIDNGGCDPLTTCSNTPGGLTCGQCPAGYYGTGAAGCSATCPCEHGGTCTTAEGEYACVCAATFTGAHCELAFVSVATGESHACGLRSDGKVVCWGYSFWGELDVPSGEFSAVAAGLYQSCGVHADSGALECWGQNTYVPAGAFTTVASVRGGNAAIAEDGTLSAWPVAGAMPSPPAGTFKQVAGSFSRFCAIDTEDLIHCFGDFASSDPPPSGTAVAVSDGLPGSCAVMSDGTLTCWFNGYGTLSPPAGSYRSVSVGISGACAVAADDTLLCFGGDGSILDAPSGTFKSVSVGYTYACAIRSDDSLVCWGTDVGGFGVLSPPY